MKGQPPFWYHGRGERDPPEAGHLLAAGMGWELPVSPSECLGARRVLVGWYFKTQLDVYNFLHKKKAGTQKNKEIKIEACQ